jgi:hypothetical protein
MAEHQTKNPPPPSPPPTNGDLSKQSEKEEEAARIKAGFQAGSPNHVYRNNDKVEIWWNGTIQKATVFCPLAAEVDFDPQTNQPISYREAAVPAEWDVTVDFPADDDDHFPEIPRKNIRPEPP